MCILCVFVILKVVSDYDLSVLSMLVMVYNFFWIGGWDLSLSSVFFGIFYFSKPLNNPQIHILNLHSMA